MFNESGRTGIGGLKNTDTETESWLTQPFGLIELTVYVIEEVGVEIGFRMLELFKNVEGLHVTVPLVTTSN
jgi:hypothetical protein